MEFVERLLSDARIWHTPYGSQSPEMIWITAGNQLISSHQALRKFARMDRHYQGWQSHHVFENQDLERMGAAHRFPPYEQQLTVLLPECAHVERVNSILRREAPRGALLQRKDLLAAYKSAYQLIDDYCGGGRQKIVAELLAIVNVILDRAVEA